MKEAMQLKPKNLELWQKKLKKKSFPLKKSQFQNAPQEQEALLFQTLQYPATMRQQEDKKQIPARPAYF